jgi:hypothetical protein
MMHWSGVMEHNQLSRMSVGRIPYCLRIIIGDPFLILVKGSPGKTTLILIGSRVEQLRLNKRNHLEIMTFRYENAVRYGAV